MATLIDGKALATKVRKRIRHRIEEEGIKAKLAVILVGNDDASIVYVRNKSKACEKVGIAFQIQDDILGIFSNEMQKNKDSDIKEFKQTILYSYVINTDYKDEFMKYYGNEKLAEKDIETVKDILIKSKAYDYAINMMNDYYDEGIKLLNEISWIKEDKKILIEGFIEYLRNRKK